MASSSLAFVASERAALADLFEEVGPDASTCCAGWTTAHLAAHVVVRDRRPDALPGYGAGEAGIGGPPASRAPPLGDPLPGGTPHAQGGARGGSRPPRRAPFAGAGPAEPVNTTELPPHPPGVPPA